MKRYNLSKVKADTDKSKDERRVVTSMRGHNVEYTWDARLFVLHENVFSFIFLHILVGIFCLCCVAEIYWLWLEMWRDMQTNSKTVPTRDDTASGHVSALKTVHVHTVFLVYIFEKTLFANCNNEELRLLQVYTCPCTNWFSASHIVVRSTKETKKKRVKFYINQAATCCIVRSIDKYIQCRVGWKIPLDLLKMPTY